VVYPVSVTTYQCCFLWAVYFISKSWSRNCYLLLGILLYFRNLLLNFFQITKGLRFNSYPVSLLIFSFLPLAVNPVGVTAYWCYSLWIMVYNFVTIYVIATKFGIRMCPFSVQVSRQLDNEFVFYSNFHTLMKRKKMKKLSQLSKVHISEKPGAI